LKVSDTANKKTIPKPIFFDHVRTDCIRGELKIYELNTQLFHSLLTG
jgi:hypothetical protein